MPCLQEAARVADEAEQGYPPKAGHFVSSITYREGLMALSGQGQLIDLR
jgi:hypothetical protein